MMGASLRLERRLILRDRGAIAAAFLLAMVLLVSFVSGLRAKRSLEGVCCERPILGRIRNVCFW